jgi:hypothetical protein
MGDVVPASVVGWPKRRGSCDTGSLLALDDDSQLDDSWTVAFGEMPSQFSDSWLAFGSLGTVVLPINCIGWEQSYYYARMGRTN